MILIMCNVFLCRIYHAWAWSQFFFSLLNLNNSWKEQNKIRSMWLRKCSVLLRKCYSEEMSGWGSVCQGIAQVGERSVEKGSVRDLSKGKLPDFGPFRPKLSLQAIFRGKLMNQTWENGKKTSFGPNFGPFGPQKNFSWILPQPDVRHCCKLSLYTISKKTNESNLRK